MREIKVCRCFVEILEANLYTKAAVEALSRYEVKLLSSIFN